MEKQIYTAYAEENDMTFIMVDTINKFGDLISTECVGWYFGEPEEDSTKAFYGELKAKY